MIIDNIIQFLFFIPVVFSTIMVIVMMLGYIIGVAGLFCTRSDKALNFFCNVVQVETAPFNAICYSTCLTFISIILQDFELIKDTTQHTINGFLICTCLWYMIYVIDVWIGMFKQYRIRKGIENANNK